jgi:hypothetical protein
MDAANAAAMSDPKRNHHFRRRWTEASTKSVVPAPTQPSEDAVGAVGLALLDAWRRKRERDREAGHD